MPKGQAYSGKFKQRVAEERYSLLSHERILQWERTYLTEGTAGLYVDRCRRKSTERSVKLPKQVEEDLLAETYWLRMEIDYLKNGMTWSPKRNSKTESASSLGTEAEIFDYFAAENGLSNGEDT